jgi:site-specific DNA recombinase
VRAVIYVRYSTDQQTEASLEDQTRECSRVIAANGLLLHSVFEDRAISAGTTERPGYQQMLAAARRHEFDVIVVEDVSRLWRNRAEYGPRSAELEDLGIHLLTCVGDDTRRDGWGMMLTLKHMMAEHYRKEVSYRTRRGLEGRARAGLSTGGRCYGYTDRDTGAIIPSEAAVIRRIIASTASQAVVAAQLNYEGIPAPRGGKWSQSTIGAIRANPRYRGAVIWGQNSYPRLASDSARRRRVRLPQALVERQDETRRIAA